MTVKQISVFLENTAGRLAEVTKLMGDHSLNLRALTIADTEDFGILRIIVDQPAKALKVLEEHGFTAKVTDVFGIEVGDQPGGLAGVLEIFHNHNLNIEYLYATLEHKANKAIVIFKVDDTALGNRLVKENHLSAVSGF